MSAITIALRLIAVDATGSGFASVAQRLLNLGRGGSQAAKGLTDTQLAIQAAEGVTIGAGAAFLMFRDGVQLAADAGANLEMATTMASIAIVDGAQHTQELQDAIVNLANNSIYRIQDVDLAFRILGERGFNTAQIIGGLGQAAVNLGEAMGGSAVDGATSLSQAMRLFTNDTLTASHTADMLTRAFYDGIPSAQGLDQYLGMVGGTANALKIPLDQVLTIGDMLTPMMGSASSAGAAFNYMLRNLTDPTQKAGDEIQHLGLKVWDAKGNFVGIQSVMDQLIAKLKGMSQKDQIQAIGNLFNVKSGRGATDLLEMLGKFDPTFNKIKADIDKVGTAQDAANKITGTAKGKWQELSTTFNDFFARAGEVINGGLKPIYTWLNTLLSKLQQNPTITKFFAGFLIGGLILSGLAMIVGGILLAAFSGFLIVVGVAVAIFTGIIATAGLLAGLWVILTTHTKLFHGQLAFLNPIIDAVRGAFGFLGNIWSTQIIPLIKQAMPLWKGIGVVLLVLVGIMVGVFFAAILIVVGAITLVVLILVKVGQGLVWLAGQWKRFTDWIDAVVPPLWTRIVAGVQRFWFGLVDWFKQGVNWVQEQWNKFVANAQRAWYGFLNAINSLIGNVGTAIKNVVNAVTTPITNMFGNAFSWGKNLIQGFINGIGSMIGNVANAASNVAGTVKRFLGFHSPTEEGPGSESDTWAPNLVRMFSVGLLSGVPAVSASSTALASAIRNGMVAPSAGVSSLGSGTYAYGGSGGYGGPQYVIIPVNLDGQEISRATLDLVRHQLQMSGMTRTFGR